MSLTREYELILLTTEMPAKWEDKKRFVGRNARTKKPKKWIKAPHPVFSPSLMIFRAKDIHLNQQQSATFHKEGHYNDNYINSSKQPIPPRGKHSVKVMFISYLRLAPRLRHLSQRPQRVQTQSLDQPQPHLQADHRNSSSHPQLHIVGSVLDH